MKTPKNIFLTIGLSIIAAIVVLSIIAAAVLAYVFMSVPNGSALLDEQICEPTFLDGGGPYYLANAPFREHIAPDANEGDALVVQGRVLEEDCKTPVAGAIVDAWQASEDGSYENEWYRGRVRTNERGEYRFETVIPKGYGEGTGYRPPHIHFKIWQGNTLRITSQMFFPEISGTRGFDDAYIMSVITKPGLFGERHFGFHNIILPRE